MTKLPRYKVTNLPSNQVTKLQSYQKTKLLSYQLTKLSIIQVTKFESTISRDNGQHKKKFDKITVGGGLLFLHGYRKQ